jgi:predicted TIM-barrel fold metal-dependent hydrolase
MKVFDSHVHIFNPKIIENVIRRADLTRDLRLQVADVEDRLHPEALLEQMKGAGVCGALMLPTSDARKLAEVNRSFIDTASRFRGWLYTAGTLHPDYESIESELSFLNLNSVHVIKLSSFSQKFSLRGSRTLEMFDRIESFNRTAGIPFSVLLDTLAVADRSFGSDPSHTTTPEALMGLVRRFPGIRFIGAHMGGLGAPFEISDRHLEPEPNFYLDTSNAAHTLTKDQFLVLLRRFGPRRILFGTDWPWFEHGTEVKLIDAHLNSAGFTPEDREAVFSGNIMDILGITVKDSAP